LESIPKDVRTRSWSKVSKHIIVGVFVSRTKYVLTKIEQEFKQAHSLLAKQKEDILANIPETKRTEAQTILDNLITDKMPCLKQLISERDSEKVQMCICNKQKWKTQFIFR
jgi:seryl-tRNA(Sec) selenium transferase